jgi:hypothetical protein
MATSRRSRTARRDAHAARRRALACVLAGALVLLALLAAGCVLAFLYLAPALLLGAMLALGRYPGERLLLARSRPRTRRTAPRLGCHRPARARLPRGGELLAAGLAGRAPPGRLPAPA